MSAIGEHRSVAVTVGFVGLLAFTSILFGCNQVGGGSGNSDNGDASAPEQDGEAPTTYTVTYDANGAYSGNEPSDQTKTEASDLTLGDNSGDLARDGYTFAGWNTADDGSGGSYAAGATYSTDADLTLYAEWADYDIGDTGPAGGVIFYDDEADGTNDIAGARYLEAAPDSTEWDNIKWGDSGTLIGGDAQLTGIGDGQAATDAIVAHMDVEPITGTAAQLADGLSHGAYTDWFLPSKDELDLMYQNKGAIGGFASDRYWSSWEPNDSAAPTGPSLAAYAWNQDFGNGNRGNYQKNSGARVRAVRAF